MLIQKELMCTILALSDIQRHLQRHSHLFLWYATFSILSINTMNPCPFSASLARNGSFRAAQVRLATVLAR